MGKWDKEQQKVLGETTARTLWELCCHDQISPDGLNCAICGDTDHQAFECPFNGFLSFIKELKL